MFKLIIKNYLAATDMDVQSLKYEGKYEQYIETLNEAAMTFYEGLLKSLTNAYICTEEYLRDQENGRVEDTLGKKKIQAQEAAKAFIEQSIFGEPEEIEEISKEITEDEIMLLAITKAYFAEIVTEDMAIANEFRYSMENGFPKTDVKQYFKRWTSLLYKTHGTSLKLEEVIKIDKSHKRLKDLAVACFKLQLELIEIEMSVSEKLYRKSLFHPYSKKDFQEDLIKIDSARMFLDSKCKKLEKTQDEIIAQYGY